jgi:hypothetical protein
MLDGAGLADVAPELALLAATTVILLAVAAKLFRWS